MHKTRCSTKRRQLREYFFFMPEIREFLLLPVDSYGSPECEHPVVVPTYGTSTLTRLRVTRAEEARPARERKHPLTHRHVREHTRSIQVRVRPLYPPCRAGRANSAALGAQ